MLQRFQGSVLDRRIQLQRPVIARDTDTGAVTTTFVAVATVWAQRLERPGGVATRADERVATREVQHLIRYRSDVQADWRVVDGARRFRQTAMPVEQGRHQGLLLTSEETTDA